ncbi:D-alanyl-D-alanine carboxypeptidase [Alsobacter sp. SYSU M60028]|uniref:serine-type D-Ala-D-Ala carboxypeptidase n=1 Tax=Alsobacter ponti TaxID=2962936 RepID=A0ABT1LIZ8_9HYPH|nr:D-alanyl-D-alanine carboxypeptidase family protein [Alsobacter ponti]MCP8941113.1 D-alanyl-D-alanine carboxypeptidase [Alsobacter ponti]
MAGLRGPLRLAAAWLARAALALAALLAPAGAAFAQQQGFQTIAPYAVLLDSDSGAVLFEKAADELMTPASMAKLMTVEILFDQIKQGKVKLDDEFPISESAWRRGGGPSGGSSMFAVLNSRVKVSDLIQGITVMSGNDAAIAVAEGIAGSEGAFATRMTARARELGLPRSTFTNATGMPEPDQRVTARELALLANHVIQTYPDLYKYFAQREFTWNKIRQQNRNPLLTMDIGADGLKTGNVGDSGFGLVGSAVQNGQRLIVVVNGLKTVKDRAEEARRILNWGFRSFESKEVFPAGATIGEARVFGGEPSSVPLVAKGPVRILVPRGASERLVARVVYVGPLRPPVAAGAQVARLKIQRGDVQAVDIPLYAAADAETGQLTRRAFDAASELAIGFVRGRFQKSGS